MIRRISAIISDFRREVPVTLLRTMKPNTMREKYSAGPKARAARAKGGANATRPKSPMLPAMKEPKAQIASAGPTLPFCAIW